MSNFMVPGSRSLVFPFGKSWGFYDFWCATHPGKDFYKENYPDYEPLGEEIMYPMDFSIPIKTTIYHIIVFCVISITFAQYFCR